MTQETAKTPSAPSNWIRSRDLDTVRIGTAWIFAVLLIMSAREYPTWPGITLCFVGATIRLWASGYIRKDTRPAVGGPYSWVRNPLYLGTYLMAVGAALSIGNYGLTVACSIVFAVIYHFVILKEEKKLEEIFGPAYLKYCALVPRFFPRPWPAGRDALLEINPESSHLSYSWELSRKNKFYEAHVTWVALIGMISLVAFLWQRFGSNA